MPIVLCTGIHEALIESRKLILENAGNVVLLATTMREIVHACRKFNIDVALIGQSGSASHKRECADLIRVFSPRTKILEIYIANDGTSVKTADSWLESPANPLQLAQYVADLSATQSKAANAYH